MSNDAAQTDKTYVFVIHDFHEFELAIRSLCMSDVLEWAGKLLNGDTLSGFRVQCRTV